MKRILKLNSFILLLSLILTSFLPANASAHANSYGYMDVQDGAEKVIVDLSLDFSELAEAFEFIPEFEAADDMMKLEHVLSENEKTITNYITSGMNVYRDELICEPELTRTSVSMTTDNYPLAHFQFKYPCAGESTRVAYNLFVDDINRSHINFATVDGEKGTQEFTFTIAEREMVIGERNWLRQATNFFILGIEHIVTGYDHILFVLCLILPAAISLGRVVEIVTAFTLGHSITLGLATLGIVTLPSQLVEAGIALSIVYVAIENILKWETKKRWLITLFFGLIHGFGFAGILQEMQLSTSTVASSLLFFNLGVEIGQITIVALVFPVLAYLRRYKRFPAFVTTSSSLIMGMGLIWFVQRLG
ncbi:HupE/UreJ family protein [Neobacillus notoginsengisoli]|uniref:HupE/UreJ family protein n=1 Tax=Neobacillus notoginsengisoli TaxID=1578198 RepID=A0A417YSU0_9BACI|nr:HupE/UreJ family protein [Neobacillus notoginsengisoli]RHW39057.1 HupE/UreJ family protein [Neobacillus notoginsengisoli]